MHCGYFDTTQKGNHSSFLTPAVEICAQSDPPRRKTPSSTNFRL